jgi:hypothetical protein
VTREITIETTEHIHFRQSARDSLAWCPSCGCQTRFLSLEEVASLMGVEPAVVDRWLRQGKLHVETSAQGCLKVCANSLSLTRARENEQNEQEV